MIEQESRGWMLFFSCRREQDILYISSCAILTVPTRYNAILQRLPQSDLLVMALDGALAQASSWFSLADVQAMAMRRDAAESSLERPTYRGACLIHG
jgi:hypothetical protein